MAKSKSRFQSEVDFAKKSSKFVTKGGADPKAVARINLDRTSGKLSMLQAIQAKKSLMKTSWTSSISKGGGGGLGLKLTPSGTAKKPRLRKHIALGGHNKDTFKPWDT